MIVCGFAASHISENHACLMHACLNLASGCSQSSADGLSASTACKVARLCQSTHMLLEACAQE